MRLYIPTCTLNFNNILSSESISPLGFYARRGFGNKRFYPVFANDKEQVILLYSKYPRFKVEENDLDNHRIVFKVIFFNFEPCIANIQGSKLKKMTLKTILWLSR